MEPRIAIVELSVTLTLLLLLKTSCLSDPRQSFVKPEDYAETCPGYPCEVIDYYANNTALLGKNYTLFFLHGTHKLTLNFEVVNATGLHFMATISSGSLIICTRPAGLIFKNVHTLSLRGLTFLQCGTKCTSCLGVYRSALRFENVVNLELHTVHVGNSTGFGVLAKNIFGKSLVTDCTFQYNRGSGTYNGGNVFVDYSDCPADHSAQYPPFLVISSSSFSHGDYIKYNYNMYESTLATGLTVILSCNGVTVHLLNVTMVENYNNLRYGVGGNLFVHFYNETSYTSSYVFIQGSRFLNGKSALGGGIAVTLYSKLKGPEQPCNNTLTIKDTEISENRAVNGGGLYIEFVVTHVGKSCPIGIFDIVNTTFRGNVAEVSTKSSAFDGGAAMHILNGFINDFVNGITKLYIRIHNITVQGSKLSNTKLVNSISSLGVAAINILKFSGDLSISDAYIIDNEVTGISIIKSRAKFMGEVFISNNTGINGGGLLVCESSYMVLAPNTTIHFTDNHASHFGGGIYAETACGYVYPSCFYQLQGSCEPNSLLRSFVDCYNIHIIMRRNTAAYAGDDIYGGSVAKCHFHQTRSNIVNSSIFYSIFDVRKNEAGHSSAVTSDPVKVCGCSQFQQHNCSVRSILYPSVYPGQTITVTVVLVGQLSGVVPGIVTVNNIEVKYITPKSSCAQLSITTVQAFKSDTNTSYSFEVLNEAVSISENKEDNQYYGEGTPFVVLVPFKDCPVGFKLDSQGRCGCIHLRQISFQCDIDTLTITRKQPNWIGYNSLSDHKGSSLIYHETCPFDYCIAHDVVVPINSTSINSDVQCSLHRTGTLCGACKEGYSAVLGGTECQDCRNKSRLYALLLSFIIGIVGVLIIFLIVTCNITTTNGTLTGLLFYANILHSNNILFTFSKTNILTVLIAWLNLDSGFTYCLYNGMDTYVNAWLLFLFPIFMWSVVAILVKLSQQYDQVARLLGGDAVRTLATLIELSYYGTLQACVRALSFTVLDYSTSHNGHLHRYVWLYDANVDYLRGKHVPLFLVGVLFSVLVLLFTALLLFVQPLQRFSHVYCFQWVNQLKPLIDAYTAPHVIKDKCRFWVGLLLLCRVLLSIAFAFNIKNKPEVDLAAIMTACVLISAIALAYGGVYKTTLLNLINTCFIVNLTLLTMTTTYFHLLEKNIYFPNEKRRTSNIGLVNVSAGVALVTAAAILCCHAYKRFAKCFKCRKDTNLLEVNENSLLHSRSGQEQTCHQ